VGLLNRHLDDAALADVWTERLTSGSSESGRPAEAHLRSCTECRARYAAFSAWLETIRLDAHAEANEVLSGERLSAQQAQIFRRLEALEHPARVIAFPRFARPIAVQPSRRRSWIAAAAAAGLVVGIGLGQLLEFGGRTAARSSNTFIAQPAQIARGTIPVGEAVQMGVQSVISQVSDESYLYEQELVPSQARVPESLQYLNAITPSARDYDSSGSDR